MLKNERFLDWVVYQVYPRSFKDSNSDGIGDLQGIISKIDHFVELGINAVWLSPCYKSPNCDNGYDISDYRDIMDEFGTLDDWKEMISKLHERGIKLIMDFVGNHTSSEHKWFKEARKSKDNPYHDYYIWSSKPYPNITSVFGGSAWEYNEETDEYYFHTFAVGQPDLNWENDKVRKEMADIIDYWVGLGVDGFRCDVLACISKDLKNGKLDNGPRLHEFIRELFGREKLRNIFTVGECSFSEDEISKICGEDRNELSCVFQFDHFNHGRTWDKFVKQPFTYDEIKNDLVRWQYFSEKNRLLYPLLTDNHDQAHFISRLGNDKEYRYECATMYAAMFYLLKGIPFIYQGQEYGSADPYYGDIINYADVETLNYYNEKKNIIDKKELVEMINFGSRDNTRRPFCWNSEKNFGFGDGESSWLKLHSRGAEINLEKDRNSNKSVFNFYKRVLALRKESNAIRHGVFKDVTVNEGYFAYMMTLEHESVLVVCNFDKRNEINGLPQFEYLFGNYDARRKPNGEYSPFETAIFKC